MDSRRKALQVYSGSGAAARPAPGSASDGMPTVAREELSVAMAGAMAGAAQMMGVLAAALTHSGGAGGGALHGFLSPFNGGTTLAVADSDGDGAPSSVFPAAAAYRAAAGAVWQSPATLAAELEETAKRGIVTKRRQAFLDFVKSKQSSPSPQPRAVTASAGAGSVVSPTPIEFKPTVEDIVDWFAEVNKDGSSILYSHVLNAMQIAKGAVSPAAGLSDDEQTLIAICLKCEHSDIGKAWRIAYPELTDTSAAAHVVDDAGADGASADGAAAALQTIVIGSPPPPAPAPASAAADAESGDAAVGAESATADTTTGDGADAIASRLVQSHAASAVEHRDAAEAATAVAGQASIPPRAAADASAAAAAGDTAMPLPGAPVAAASAAHSARAAAISSGATQSHNKLRFTEIEAELPDILKKGMYQADGFSCEYTGAPKATALECRVAFKRGATAGGFTAVRENEHTEDYHLRVNLESASGEAVNDDSLTLSFVNAIKVAAKADPNNSVSFGGDIDKESFGKCCIALGAAMGPKLEFANKDQLAWYNELQSSSLSGFTLVSLGPKAERALAVAKANASGHPAAGATTAQLLSRAPLPPSGPPGAAVAPPPAATESKEREGPEAAS